jgi:hypothetical protein
MKHEIEAAKKAKSHPAGTSVSGSSDYPPDELNDEQEYDGDLPQVRCSGLKLRSDGFC